MKQRVFFVALALCLYMSAILMVHAEGEDFSQQEGFITEEDNAEPVPYAAGDIPTQEEVYNTLIALKTQEGYTEGTLWDDNNHSYKWHGGSVAGNITGGTGCAAFAFELSDKAFGSLPARTLMTGQFQLSDVRAGDILRINNNSHIVIVLQVADGGVVIAEGNYHLNGGPGIVHWERSLSKEVVEAATFFITRYPEGYIPPGDSDKTEKDSGTFGNGLTWKLTNAGTLTISGSGAMPDFAEFTDRPWNDYMTEIRTIRIESGVTTIGSNAFYGSKAFSVTIPSSVTTIGSSAFRKSAVISVTIPRSVQTIGDDAFRECVNLVSVNVSEGVKTIGERAFRSCIELYSITLPASVSSVGAAAFFECKEMENATFMPRTDAAMITMNANMFSECWNLTNVTLPRSVNCIADDMFLNCSLTSIIIPQGAESIGARAFASNTRLESVYIPVSVKQIEAGAFSDCPLKMIDFGGSESQWNSVSKIGDTSTTLAKVPTINYGVDPPAPEDPVVPPTTEDPENPSTPGQPANPSAPGQTTPSSSPNPGSTPVADNQPYIPGETGKDGWDIIKEEAVNAPEGTQIPVNMNGASVVPGNVLDGIKGKDISLVIDMGNGVMWRINGKNVTAEHVNDVNLSVQVGTEAIPQSIISTAFGERPNMQISLAHSGYFGFSAVLIINVNPENAGSYANLFYFNADTGKLEFVCADQVAADGIAELVFTHASDYVIVFDDKIMGENPDGTLSEGRGGATNSGNSPAGGVKSPNTGDTFFTQKKTGKKQ